MSDAVAVKSHMSWGVLALEHGAVRLGHGHLGFLGIVRRRGAVP
jgi:hypothetical protein